MQSRAGQCPPPTGWRCCGCRGSPGSPAPAAPGCDLGPALPSASPSQAARSPPTARVLPALPPGRTNPRRSRTRPEAPAAPHLPERTRHGRARGALRGRSGGRRAAHAPQRPRPAGRRQCACAGGGVGSGDGGAVRGEACAR